MNERWCSGCGETFLPRPQSPRQAYCSKVQCQKARKLLWQRTKRRSDPDYLDNQSKANTAWARRNPDYWRNYRARDVVPIQRLRDLADILAGSILRMLEDTSAKDEARPEGRSNRKRHDASKQAASSIPSAVTLAITVELRRGKHTYSAKTRKETT